MFKDDSEFLNETRKPGRHSTTFFDLLSEESKQELLLLREDPQKNRSLQNWSPSRKGFIPTEVERPGHFVQGIRYNYTGGDSFKLFRDLVWTACFGYNRFKIIHWYLLWNIFEKNLEDSPRSEALLRILRSTTSREGSSWNTTLKPLKTIATNALGSPEKGLKYTMKILEDLELKLGTKDPGLLKTLKFYQSTRKCKRAPDPRRIGVGYKDKGNLSQEVKSDLEIYSEDYFLPEENLFLSLIQRTEDAEALVDHYDPRKARLLQKLRDTL